MSWQRATTIVAWVLSVGLYPADARAEDAWLGRDKAPHFWASLVLSVGAYAASSLFVDEPWQRAVAAGAFSLSVGAGKEAWDAAGYGDPSLKDFTWDVAGTGVGVGAAFTVDVSWLAGGAVARQR